MHMTIVLGGGCFWCIEAVYANVKGIKNTVSGYMGGHLLNPSYEAVCTGTTGHAEVVKLTYDPSLISLETILDIFWIIHDPTTLNQQGNDIGTQYRSVIFYQDETQKRIAHESMELAQTHFKEPIVTEIKEVETFYEAETYHQDYFKNNPSQGYCIFVVAPKIAKFRQTYPDFEK